MRRLYPQLIASRVPEVQLSEWTSHCFRRGCGIDTLHEKGVDAIVSVGDWSNPRAAEPYASADEQSAVRLSTSALRIIDASDDEV